MKRLIAISALLWALAAGAASAACVAEYKAKQDNPLRLDHGTITVQAASCTPAGVQAAVAAQLQARGWILLSILSVRESG